MRPRGSYCGRYGRHQGSAEGARVAAFNVVPAGKVAWTYEEGENGLTSGSGAVVLTVAGDSDALPGTETARRGHSAGNVPHQGSRYRRRAFPAIPEGPEHADSCLGGPLPVARLYIRRLSGRASQARYAPRRFRSRPRLPHRLHCVTSIKLPLMGRAVKQTPQWGVCRRGANDSEPNNREETLNPAYTKH